jgi:predicted enzyme related to lactoylglutathione lyase
MSTGHLGFTKLLVTDLETSSAFYQSVFGLEENYRVRSQIGDRKIEEILFRSEPGQATFVLLAFEGATTPSADEVILGFITSDLAGVFDRAVKAGGRVFQAQRSEPEHGVTVGFVTDNEGHLIEVVQPLA